MSLDYLERKKALVEALCDDEEWDWDDATIWEAFFDESDESQHTLRRFVDVQRLRFYFGNRELDDFDNDMGMDAHQYRSFSAALFENLGLTLRKSAESGELALLDAIGAAFATKHTVCIKTSDVYGDALVLRFTRNVYSDGRADEVIGPFDSNELHELIDETGEWLEMDAEYADDDSQLDLHDGGMVDNLPDVPEIDEDMELRFVLDSQGGSDLGIPQFDEDADYQERGLGDRLSE
jgi:hypothetical protein